MTRRSTATVVVIVLLVVGCATTTEDPVVGAGESTSTTVVVDANPTYETTGFELIEGVEPYPWPNPHGLDIDPTDDDGLHLYEKDGVRYLHPVAQAQYVLLMLNSYRLTEDQVYLDRALLNLDALIEAGDWRGSAVYFEYGFDFPLYGLPELTLHAPWWSGMAQGQALSALVRAYEATGTERYLEVADAAFETFYPSDIAVWPVSEPVVSLVDDADMLWFEEYAGDLEPSYVLNGHIFAIYGLYDYWELTGSPEAAEMIDGAATAVLHYMPEFRNGPGKLSWYGITIKPNERGLHERYHRIHKEQLATLAAITGDDAFAEWSELLASDL